MEKYRVGRLYLCATPIGNLEDITLRALRILRDVDIIAAEDTRRTLKLLNHYEISKPLISYHEHNKGEKGKEIVDMLKRGMNIALVSDAGMPGISDPGADLVVLATDAGITCTVVPGPSAALSALVLSGLSTKRFAFEGFLPREKKERREKLTRLKNESRTLIFYESPHRLVDVLKDMYSIFGSRRITLVRELTKIHEEVIPMDLKDAAAYYSDKSPRGEYVLVLEGKDSKSDLPDYSSITVMEHLKAYLDAGMDKKEAIKQVAKDRGIPRNEVYKYSITL